MAASWSVSTARYWFGLCVLEGSIGQREMRASIAGSVRYASMMLVQRSAV